MLLEVPPGEHTIYSKRSLSGDGAATVKTAAGKNYFFQRNDFGIEQVDKNSGKKAVFHLSMVDVPERVMQSIAGNMKRGLPAVVPAPIKPETPVKITKPTKAPTERLVLMPLRVGEDSRNLQGAMETALVQGLQKYYVVFSGEQVSQKAREIFLKETRNTTKRDCDETRCMQNIAMAFQAELIATANVTKQDGGYFLVLSIQNIFDHKVVYSNSVPCRSCDSFQVVDKLKEMSGEPVLASR